MTVRFIVRWFVAAALLLSAQGATAQPGSTVQSPIQTLSQFPDGGQGMENAVQTLMDADRANLAAIIAFAKAANEDQRKAIGRALAVYAQASAKGGDPAFANTVQQAVENADLPELSKAYADAGGDTGTAAAGGGGGGGSGGPTAGGPPTGGPNTGTTAGGSTLPTTRTGLLLTGTTSGGGFSSNGGSSSLTEFVSP
jgi:hypothetical protein